MLYTAKACFEAEITFAAVHDSYWTHACSVNQMGDILRTQFIKVKGDISKLHG
jgi:DNA-directed RNA polymerase